MRRIVILLLVGSATLLPRAPAIAGGWWTTLDFHDQHVGIGESLSFKVGEVLFDSIEAAEEAEHEKYYAYLVADYDRRLLDKAMSVAEPKDWWRPLAPPIRAGTVTLTGRDGNLTGGRVHLSVPEIPTGGYSLMLCDAGCENPLANHIPVPINVSADVLAAQTARRLDRSNDRLTVALVRVRNDARRTQRRIDALQESQVVPPEPAKPSEVPTADREDPPPWIAYAGWFLAGGLATFILAGRRRRRLPDDVFVELVPDDARELTRTS